MLIVLLKLDFNCFNSFALSWVDNVTTRTSSFLSVIVNVDIRMAIGASIVKQFEDQGRIRLIPQLINGISRVLQKLLKYFNGNLMWTFFYHHFLFHLLLFFQI